MDPEEVKSLNLTDEQKEKIKKVVQEMRGKVMDLRKEGGNADRRDRQKLLALLEKAEPCAEEGALEDILALLTLEQRLRSSTSFRARSWS